MRPDPISLLVPAAALAVVAACSGDPQRRHSLDEVDVPPPLVLEGSAYDAAGEVALPEVPPGEYPGLHNVYRLSDRIISGAEPADEEALAQLADWGVKTILSVDGKVPDAETAEALGIEYVHVPIQYKGITHGEILDIAKTFRELEGPFYVHCFHGKHRGPAAAAIGRVALDGVGRDKAIAEMRQWCSTSKKYEGLYATVAAADIPSATETAAHDFDFTAAHRFEGLRGVMIEMARKKDNVAFAVDRGWAPDPEHPDVVPAEELNQLHQLYEAFAAMDDVDAYPDDFRATIDEGRADFVSLVRLAGESGQEGVDADAWLTEFETIWDRVTAGCSSCHAAYRNR